MATKNYFLTRQGQHLGLFLKSLALVAGCLFFIGTIQAGTFTWTGTASKNWSVADNWSPLGAPNNDGTDDIIMGLSTRLINRANGGWDINSLTFAPGAGAYVIAGFTADEILLEGGGILNSSTALQTLNHPLLLNSSQTWSASAGNLSLGGSINLFSFGLTASGAKDIALGGPVSGNGSIVKSGSGKLTLTAANPFSGTLNVNGGWLVAGGAGALGSVQSIGISGGATLGFDTSGGGAINASAPITLSGGNISAEDQSEALGYLLVNTESTVQLKADSVRGDLTLAGMSIAPGSRLVIDGWLGENLGNRRTASLDDRIFVNSDPGVEVLSRIYFDGFDFGAYWDPLSKELTAAIPEPSAVAMIGLGLATFGLWRTRRLH